MSWTLSVVSGGTEYQLADNDNYLLTALGGIGMAPVKRLSEQGPQQHGASDVGFRLQPRRLTLSVYGKGGTDAEWFTRRNTLLRIFRPTDDALALKLTNGATVRQIDCYFSASLDMPFDQNLGSTYQQAVIELLAPDPTWYDPVGTSITYGLGGSGDSMEVPLAVPWKVGAASIDLSKAVSYDGTWDAFPIITIEGPIDDCIITNESLDLTLDFTGLNLAAGATRVIDCRYGQKTVVDGSGTNKIADLTAASDLATFRLGAHPKPLDGLNSLSVSGTNITAATDVFIQYHERFVGA